GPRVWVRCSCALLGFAGRLGGHAVSRRRERHATRAQPASFPEGVDGAAPAPHVAWGVFHRGLLGSLPPAVVAGPEESGSARRFWAATEAIRGDISVVGKVSTAARIQSAGRINPQPRG